MCRQDDDNFSRETSNLGFTFQRQDISCKQLSSDEEIVITRTGSNNISHKLRVEHALTWGNQITVVAQK